MTEIDGTSPDLLEESDLALDLGAETRPEQRPEADESEPLTLRRWEQVRCYGFELGDYRLLVRQGRYCELIASYSIADLPNGPDYLLGLINVRGNLVPVYDLQAVLEGRPKEKHRYALMIGKPLKAAALTIPRKPVSFDLSSLLPAGPPEGLPAMLAGLITDTYLAADTPWSVIDDEKLFRLLAAGG